MNGRKGLRALSLSFLAVLGFMAFMAVGAQANWLHLNAAGTVSLENSTASIVEVSDHVDGLLLVPAKNLEILCHETEENDILLLPNSTLATGKLVFDECLTFSVNKVGHLLPAPSCDPVNQPIEAGGKAHIILHNGVNYILFEPEEGLEGIFTVVEFGELCALTETSEVTGTLVAECGHLQVLTGGVEHPPFLKLDCANHQVTQLLREADQSLFGGEHGLLFGENKATIDGIAAVKLGGGLTGRGFGGHI